MKFEFTKITQVWVHYSKSFSRVKSSQEEKVRFILGNELKLTQIELFSFFYFKRVHQINHIHVIEHHTLRNE